ncbi:ExbD/TolR family protein [Flavobacterium quisquiliarum]|uniref:ExbD/TolR family protein n=1 Tax=Flavobacterium quisquiliarum TaxID=1834436 RepID=A0ABV8WG42_9FLAO|nr:biopolymer transporter ExbD [Flavobacterium quisquiliarum]MBW1655700.1 biopolymer transporter ExbD [Flavobacterium quisquiliarum]NWK99989.1 biopolymer transporter ExbD [Flavobacterium collinsii]
MKNLPQKVRSKKLHSRVDLTAMVSVSFLLIIFFMLVGELSKPKILDLSAGSDCCDCPVQHYGENRTLTIILGPDNKLIYYAGLLAVPKIKPQTTQYGKEGIRKKIAAYNNTALKYAERLGKPGRSISVIIKPTKKSNYGNLIDILDELEIANIDSYAIVPEFTPEETKLLALK